MQAEAIDSSGAAALSANNDPKIMWTLTDPLYHTASDIGVAISILTAAEALTESIGGEAGIHPLTKRRLQDLENVISVVGDRLRECIRAIDRTHDTLLRAPRQA